jgi:hypothetical protein
MTEDRWSAFGKRILERDCRQYFIVDGEQLSRIFRLVKSLRDDQRHSIAHMAHDIFRQHGAQRAVMTRALWNGRETRTRQALDVFRNNVVARQDTEYARGSACRPLIHANDSGVGVR